MAIFDWNKGGANPPDEKIVYLATGKEEEPELFLYIYKPENWRESDRRPLMLMIHGGGWRAGNPAQFATQCRDYARSGFMAATVSYRLASPEQGESYFQTIRDVKSALRYARAHAAGMGIDPARIIAAGSSAGGHLAVAAAMFESYNNSEDDLSVSCVPDAIVLMCPALDAVFYTGTILNERAKEFSIAHQVRKQLPPQLILLGTDDHVFPENLARNYQQAVHEVGGKCELVMFKGAKHAAFYSGTYYQESRSLIMEFLRGMKFMHE